jgi:hypothetical protein
MWPQRRPHAIDATARRFGFISLRQTQDSD